MDILDCLVLDTAAKILTCLDDISDLVHAGAVSRSWRQFLIEAGLCKQLCLKKFPQLSRVASVVELNKQVTEDPAEVGSSSNGMEWESKVREHSAYALLARLATSFDPGNCILEAISASSTDNYPEESVANTLVPRDVIARRASYWSSTGKENDNAPETLIYKLSSNLCVITEISIQPFQAFFQPGLPIYSAKAVRFRMGHPKSPIDLEHGLTNNLCHDDKFIWTYTSQVFEMDQLNCLQKFKLPEPVLFIGGYLQIELLGRVQKQEMDRLYYICVSHVKVSGHSLAPAFDAESIDPSGMIILKRDMQPDISPKKSPENNLSSTRADNLEERVRTLEQIVEMLRGNEFMYEWQWQDGGAGAGAGAGDEGAGAGDESDEEFLI